MAKWPNLTDLVCWRWRWAAEVTSSPPQVFELIKVIRVIRVIRVLIVKVVIVVALIDIFMIIV